MNAVVCRRGKRKSCLPLSRRDQQIEAGLVSGLPFPDGPSSQSVESFPCAVSRVRDAYSLSICLGTPPTLGLSNALSGSPDYAVKLTSTRSNQAFSLLP